MRAPVPLGRQFPILVAGVIGLIAFAWTTWHHRYVDTMGDPDSLMAIAGVRQAQLHGSGLLEPTLYFASGQPLFYLVWIHAAPTARLSMDALVQWSNGLAWVALCLSLLALLVCLWRRFDVSSATTSVLLLATSPVVFEMATYLHPATLALCAALIGCMFLQQSLQVRRRTLRVALAGFSTLWFVVALGMRTDCLLMMPALLLALLPATRRAQISALLVLVVSVGVYFIGLSWFPERHDLGTVSLWDAVARYQDVHRLPRGMAKLLLAVGLGTCLIVLAALVMRCRHHGQRTVLLCLLLLPPLILSVTNPWPARRFLYMTVLLVVVAAGALRFVARHQLVAALILGLGINLLGAPVLQAVLQRVHPASLEIDAVRHLSTSVWDRTRGNQAYMTWKKELWKAEFARVDEDCLVIGSWGSHSHILAEASRRGLPIERQRLAVAPTYELVALHSATRRIMLWNLSLPVDHGVQDWGFRRAWLMRPYPDRVEQCFEEVTHKFPPDGLALHQD